MTIEELQKRVDDAHGPSIKVNLIHPDGDTEGLWGKLATKEDKEIYDRDTQGDKITVFIMNQALVSGPTWGVRIQITTQHGSRPSVDMDSFIQQCIAQADEYPRKEN